MNLDDCRILTYNTFRKFGRVDLIHRVSVEYNTRLRTTAGRATYSRLHQTGKIQLSNYVFNLANEDEQYKTVVHEACHILDRVMNGHFGHRRTWRNLMIQCGLPPERCHRVVLPRELVTVYCGCGDHPVTKNKYTRMRNGTLYRCRACNTLLQIYKRVSEANHEIPRSNGIGVGW